MADDLIFYTNPQSRGAIVRWMLEEVGQPYRTELLGYGTTMKSPEYLAINPMGKVPAIVHNGRVVTEAAAICAYLADAFPGAGLAPPPGERDLYYRWMFFAAGPAEQAIINRAMGFVIPEGREVMAGYGSYDLMVEALANAVKGRNYVASDRFTAADVYVGSQIGWGLAFGTLPARPEFQAYWSGLENRPARQRAHDADAAAQAELSAATG